MKLLLVGALALCAAAYHNPIINSDAPDPGVIYYDGLYWMAVTKNDIPAYPIRSSPDLVNWTDRGYAFTAENKPSWAQTNFWAPEFHVVNGHLNLYFSARNAQTQLKCIGVATAEKPTGPWKATDSCLVSSSNSIIDVTVIHDHENNKYYAVYKDEQTDVADSPIHAVELSADGLSAVGEPVEILRRDQIWEGALIEGPFHVYRNGWYYLFYSGNGYTDPEYGIGVARSKNALGPYEKAPVPIFVQGADGAPGHTFTATAHGSVFKLGDSDVWYAINHAYYCGQVGGGPGRVVILDRVWWTEDDWPIMGQAGSAAEGERPDPTSKEGKEMKPDIRVTTDGRQFSIETYQGWGCVTADGMIAGDCNTDLWVAHKGFAGHNTVSFESVNRPGHYLRHYAQELRSDENDGSDVFKYDASWLIVAGLRDPNHFSIRPSNYEKNYVRHKDSKLRYDTWDGTNLMAEDGTWKIHYKS